MRAAIYGLITSLTAGAFLFGCFPLETEDEFKDAIPVEDDLLVKIGSSDAESVAPAGIVSVAGILDPYAKQGCEDCCIETVDGEEWYVDGDIYQLTRGAKWHVNGGLVVAMGWVWAIVNSPPSDETDDGYIWGPWRESLSRVEFRFVMEKTASKRFAFSLEGKNINETENVWTSVVEGDVVVTDEPHAVSGSLTLDYSAIHDIDTAHPTPASGRIAYKFDVTSYPFTLEATFEDFAYEEGEALSAVYKYQRLGDDMAGKLSFAIDGDTWPEEALDGVAETLAVESQWNGSGKGKGEASISGGTMEMEESTVERGALTECWADSKGLFYTTYQALSVEHSDGAADESAVICGEIDHCPTFE